MLENERLELLIKTCLEKLMRVCSCRSYGLSCHVILKEFVFRIEKENYEIKNFNLINNKNIIITIHNIGQGLCFRRCTSNMLSTY